MNFVGVIITIIIFLNSVYCSTFHTALFVTTRAQYLCTAMQTS